MMSSRDKISLPDFLKLPSTSNKISHSKAIKVATKMFASVL